MEVPQHSIACFIRPLKVVYRLRCVLPCHGTLKHGPCAGPCDEARLRHSQTWAIRIGLIPNGYGVNFGLLKRSCFNSASSACSSSSSREHVVLHHFGCWSVFGEHILATTKRIARNGRVGQLLGRPVARLCFIVECRSVADR